MVKKDRRNLPSGSGAVGTTGSGAARTGSGALGPAEAGALGQAREGEPAAAQSPLRGSLLAALTATGLDEESATALADAALVLGAATQGTPIGSLELGFTSPSARAATEVGSRPRAGAAPGSVDAHRHAAEVALTGIEAITSAQMRLDGALVAAAGAQTASIGAALLAQNDLTVDDLSTSRRERWRSQAKSRTRAEVAPATGWGAGESAHLIALANSPVAFSTPVIAQMRRGQLPWRLARVLWRACNEARLDAADAAHVAHVMCADDPDTAVPERLEPDGTVTTAPWNHRAFWTALDREIAKLVHADDADPQDAAAEKAARQAAFTARSVIAKVGQDGMGSLTVLLPNFWVAAIKDRLLGAAIAAHAAGDARTTDQLQSDIARALLAHAALGFADTRRAGFLITST